MKKYFTSDDDGRIKRFDTEPESVEYANGLLTTIREGAKVDGEWPEEVTSICCGRITMAVVEKGGPGEDYELKGVESLNVTGEEGDGKCGSCDFERKTMGGKYCSNCGKQIGTT